MPYIVKKVGDEFCVFNRDTEEQKACHATEVEAERQVKLLHSIEKDEDI